MFSLQLIKNNRHSPLEWSYFAGGIDIERTEVLRNAFICKFLVQFSASVFNFRYFQDNFG